MIQSCKKNFKWHAYRLDYEPPSLFTILFSIYETLGKSQIIVKYCEKLTYAPQSNYELTCSCLLGKIRQQQNNLLSIFFNQVFVSVYVWNEVSLWLSKATTIILKSINSLFAQF